MITFTIATTTSRTQVIEDSTKTLAEILMQQGLSTAGMTYHVDGTPVRDANKSLADLHVGDGSTITAIPAQKAGNR